MSENALADTPFNHKTCNVPGYETAWVRFKTSGYPKKLRDEWDAAGSNRAIEIITRYVEDWAIPDLAGSSLFIAEIRSNALARADAERRAGDPALALAERARARNELAALPDALGEVEDAVVIWLVRTFKDFWLTELTAPRKN